MTRDPHAPLTLPAAVRPPMRVLRSDQVADVGAYAEGSIEGAPTWFSAGVQHELGVLLETDLLVVGAPPKAGKTSFLLAQLEHLATTGHRVVYFPLETTPTQFRLMWAAARCGYPWDAVASRRWEDLPEDARDALMFQVKACAQLPVQFPPDAHATVASVLGWCEWARQEYGATIAVIDHFHRLDLGGTNNYRIAVTEAVIALKNYAVTSGMVLLVAAQFSRSRDPLDLVQVHGMDRFAESSALEREASIAITLSRVMQRDTPPEALRAVRNREQGIGTILEPGAMRVHCCAHRRRDMGQVRDTLLTVTPQFARDPHYGERGYRHAKSGPNSGAQP